MLLMTNANWRIRVKKRDLEVEVDGSGATPKETEALFEKLVTKYAPDWLKPTSSS